jgi:hypothetical protein
MVSGPLELGRKVKTFYPGGFRREKKTREEACFMPGRGFFELFPPAPGRQGPHRRSDEDQRQP